MGKKKFEDFNHFVYFGHFTCVDTFLTSLTVTHTVTVSQSVVSLSWVSYNSTFSFKSQIRWNLILSDFKLLNKIDIIATKRNKHKKHYDWLHSMPTWHNSSIV